MSTLPTSARATGGSPALTELSASTGPRAASARLPIAVDPSRAAAPASMSLRETSHILISSVRKRPIEIRVVCHRLFSASRLPDSELSLPYVAFAADEVDQTKKRREIHQQECVSQAERLDRKVSSSQ